jgi:hypothetical protein
MKNLKRLGLSLSLICILATAAFADETAPPCTEPGQTNTPPCAAHLTLDGSAAPGDIYSLPASITEGEYSMVDAAIDLLQSVLLIF